MMRFVALEKLINLHDGYTQKRRVGFDTVLLLQRDGTCYVIESQCPHREQALDAVHIDGAEIVCPSHGYRFSLRDGQLLHFSEEPCRGLRTWPVIYRDKTVGIEWDDLAR